MSTGGWFDNSDAQYRLSRLTGQADADRFAATVWQPGRWRCRIRWHDWRAVETPDRDKYAECTRCGKRDWRRLIQNVTGKYRGAIPRQGRGCRSKTRPAGSDVLAVWRQARQRSLRHLGIQVLS